MTPSTAADVAVIGAGPYGLAVAAHLRGSGVEALVFGRPMSFWRQHMPKGMLLRSSPSASSISDPERRLTLARYSAAHGVSPLDPVPLDDFIAYTDWFRLQLGISVDSRQVTRVERARDGFRIHLDDGETKDVARIVVAAGIAPFARRPAPFRDLGEPLVIHSVDLRDTAAFRDRRVVVIGAGQSALETAALLHEAGCDVEIVARAPRIRWIPNPRAGGVAERIERLAHAPTEVGPRGISWVAAMPDIFRRLPGPVQAQIGPVCIAPMGAYWLPPRLRDVSFALDRRVVSVARRNGRLLMRLNAGEAKEADHVVLGTGFHVDVRLYDFLAPELAQGLRLADGSPELGTGLESSIPGLHFVGAPAAHTFGPVMRFVVGTAYAAPALVRRILGRPPLPVIRAW
jgi:hypothetical protein